MNRIMDSLEREIQNHFGADLAKQQNELSAFRWPALKAEEQQLPTAAVSIPYEAAEENNDAG